MTKMALKTCVYASETCTSSQLLKKPDTALYFFIYPAYPPQGQTFQDLGYFLWMSFIPQTSTRGISGHLTQHQVPFAETTEPPFFSPFFSYNASKQNFGTYLLESHLCGQLAALLVTFLSPIFAFVPPQVHFTEFLGYLE